MSKSLLIFLDTETTGTGPGDRLCQVAFHVAGQEYESLFKPPVPISIDAMAVSHITNKMVADKDPFLGSVMHRQLIDLFDRDHILVAHNAAFDVEMLKREQLSIDRVIDTYKIAQHLDPLAEVPRYNLQYLRYYFDLEVQNAIAHHALGDVRVLVHIFDLFLATMLQQEQDETKVLQKMIDISNRPTLLKKFNFGKYKGELVGSIALEDQGYLRWLLDTKIRDRDEGNHQDVDWIHTLQHHLRV